MKWPRPSLLSCQLGGSARQSDLKLRVLRPKDPKGSGTKATRFQSVPTVPRETGIQPQQPQERDMTAPPCIRATNAATPEAWDPKAGAPIAEHAAPTSPK